MEHPPAIANPSSRKPLWYIMAAFSVVLVANGFLIFYAANSWTGLETKQPFAKGLAYNTNIEAARHQRLLGWQTEMTTSFNEDDKLSGSATVHFSDKNSYPLTDLEVRIAVTRPTHEGYDQEFDLVHLGDGVYRGAFTLPLKGQWDFRILARRDRENFQRVERLVTP